MKSELKLIHIQIAESGLVIGISDTDKGVRSIIREFIKDERDRYKDVYKDDIVLRRYLLKVWKWVKVDTIKHNKLSEIEVYYS